MITRWNPFREMATMQRMMDRFFDDWRPFFDEENAVTGARSLALDVHEDDKSYTVTTEMPGVQSDNIHVRYEGDYLVIEGEIPEQKTDENGDGKHPILQERRYGHYSRRLRLPQNIDFDKADARYEDGVLTLNLPKTEASQPKLIPVKTVSKN